MACEKKSRIEDGRRQEKTKRVVCVGWKSEEIKRKKNAIISG